MGDRLDLDRLTAAEAAATPGPWGWKGHSSRGGMFLSFSTLGGPIVADSIQDQFLAVEALAVRPARAAELLDMSRESIYNLMRAGELASFKIGGSRRIPVDSLREFIARRLARESAVQVDHRMTKAEELVVHEVTYRDDITDIDHPDARLIYEARNALPALLVVALAAQEAMPYLRMLGHLEDPAVQLANSRPLNEIMADLKAALDG